MKLIMRLLPGCAVCCAAAAAVAAPQVYTIDSAHTYPSFEATHMGLSYWRGKFDKTSGKIWLDREHKTGKVDISVDVRSINFGMPALDKIAQGDDFFKADKYPTATYKSDSITFTGDTPTSVDGELTMAGVTKPLKLTISLFKCVQHPMFKREVCGGDVHAEFDRREFGMMRDIIPSDPNVRLAIQVEAIQGDSLPQMGPPPGGRPPGGFPGGGPPGGAFPGGPPPGGFPGGVPPGGAPPDGAAPSGPPPQ